MLPFLFFNVHFPELHKTLMNVIAIRLYSKDIFVYLIIKKKYTFFDLYEVKIYFAFLNHFETDIKPRLTLLYLHVNDGCMCDIRSD